MGAAQTKAKKEYGTDIEGIDLIDLIATKYILTQNFQDLKNLTKKEYCDKLVILTSDIIKKFMNQKEIKYLAERTKRGNYVNEEVKKKLMFLNTNKVREAEQNDMYNSKEMKGGSNLLEVLVGKDNIQKLTKDMRPKKKEKEKTVLSELDVPNRTEKQRMCNGIAKFYISIAHLYAAIVKTLNPVYVYEDRDGKMHAMSIQNRDKVPRNVRPMLKQINLCSKRIAAVSPSGDGNIEINLKNVCKMNSQRQTITMENEWRPSKWSEGERVNTRKLGQEPGIPELQHLYWNKYDYLKGNFMDGMLLANSEAQKDYAKDLRAFYTTYTGKNDYDSWNSDGSKRFTDIPLIAYHESPLCADDGSWKQTYSGSSGLFVDYANQVKKMMTNSKQAETKLMGILRQVFKIYPGTERTGEFVSLNPELTEDKLDKIINDARKIIVKLYLTCERDFKDTLDIFEGIMNERIIKNAVEKKNLANELQDQLISQPPNPSTTKKIKSALLNLFK